MDASAQCAGDANGVMEPAFARYRLPQNVAALAGPVLVKNDRGELAFEIDGGDRAAEDVVRIRDVRKPAACFIWGHTLLSPASIEIVDANGLTCTSR